MAIKYKNFDEYISQFPEELQNKLQQIRMVIRDSAPDATEKISYGMPTFYLNGNLVHFAAFKNHIGLYPTPSAIEAFEEELTSFKTSKGAIQFPLDESIPFELIKKIVDFRVLESTGK
jgi:uncharacterized protein YdhG (YjbR/CyaY superfamily)